MFKCQAINYCAKVNDTEYLFISIISKIKAKDIITIIYTKIDPFDFQVVILNKKLFKSFCFKQIPPRAFYI